MYANFKYYWGKVCFALHVCLIFVVCCFFMATEWLGFNVYSDWSWKLLHKWKVLP